MIAISLILLLAAVVVAVLSGAALHAVRGLRREVAGLRRDLAARTRTDAAATALPTARTAPVGDEVRAAVAEALAAERERELAEARAFWAEQEARAAEDAAGFGHGPYGGHQDYGVSAVDAALLDALLDEVADGPEAGPLLPRQPDRQAGDRPGGPRPDGGFAPLPPFPEPLPEVFPYPEGLPGAALPEAGPVEPTAEPARTGSEEAGPADGEAAHGEPAHVEAAHTDVAEAARADAEAAGRAAARRRHPSNPHHTLSGEPVVPAQGGGLEDEAQLTVERLAAVASAGTELTDVRPGPLGTLDVYVFADGTTLCLSPGHQDTAHRLSGALRAGSAPVLLGGSGVSGGYALTFAYGDETVYVLADRVIASL
ncbi:hypothetical protein GCM10023347_51350 [Streptomyces chumphonensis]|uniref:Secreted protein n=1 Tax=Streptomyces chumphonensis TaxID=1214925 RepID=A0A927IES6_9ACTN|nr:hypothetical protein [Streptomyces chumphonensis]MBD3934487.1 hypothetical protein [Streptomyces chumphonensis]